MDVASPRQPLSELFKSLGDPTRLRILRVLSREELPVGTLAEVLGMAQSGISRHLSLLKSAGLVRLRREGVTHLYRLPDEPEDPRLQALWASIHDWLGELPQAEADDVRLARVMAARSSKSLEFFQEVAPHWDGLREAQYGEDLRQLALLELLPRDLTVLDVGTGTGFMLAGVASRVQHFIGVDPSEAMLSQAASNLESAGFAQADLRRGTMEALPVDAATVDVVLANMVLHHAEDPTVALKEMARVLRPGGRVVLTDLARHEHGWTAEELADAWPGFETGELEDFLRAADLIPRVVRTAGTCSLHRKSGETHEVGVLLVTADRIDTRH